MTFQSSGISRRSLLAGGMAALALPIVMAGCSRPAADPDALRIAWWGGEARAAKMNKILDAFEREGKVTFRREFADYNAYWERFSTQAAARTLPDLMSMTEQQVGDYATSLEDLLPAVNSGKLDLSSWEKKYIDAGMVDGRLVQLFLGGTIPSLCYNRTALTAAGYAGDPNEWTWDEFFDATVAIAGAGSSSSWGSTDGGGVSQQFDTYLHQRGKAVITDGALGWEPSDLEEYLTRWDELRKAGGTPPIDVTSEFLSAPFEDSQIVRGDVVFQTGNHNQFPVLQSYVKDTLLPTTLPVFDGGKRAAVNAGTYVSVAANSNAKEKAVEYLNFFVNTPEIITEFQAEYGGLPSPKASDILAPNLTDNVRRSLEFYRDVEPVAGIVPVWPKGGLKVIQLIRTANEAVANGAKPSEAATACFEQAKQASS